MFIVFSLLAKLSDTPTLSFLFRRLFFYKKWYSWNGKYYEEDPSGGAHIRFIMMHQLSSVYGRVRDQLRKELEDETDKKKAQRLEDIIRGIKNYNNSSAVKSTMEVMQGEMYAPDLFALLDKDVHIINCRNGIWQLKTGALDTHRPQYMCTRMIDLRYMVSISQLVPILPPGPLCCLQMVANWKNGDEKV
jgi:phage/plasmid-associated DNA primase